MDGDRPVDHHAGEVATPGERDRAPVRGGPYGFREARQRRGPRPVPTWLCARADEDDAVPLRDPTELVLAAVGGVRDAGRQRVPRVGARVDDEARGADRRRAQRVVRRLPAGRELRDGDQRLEPGDAGQGFEVLEGRQGRDLAQRLERGVLRPRRIPAPRGHAALGSPGRGTPTGGAARAVGPLLVRALPPADIAALGVRRAVRARLVPPVPAPARNAATGVIEQQVLAARGPDGDAGVRVRDVSGRAARPARERLVRVARGRAVSAGVRRVAAVRGAARREDRAQDAQGHETRSRRCPLHVPPLPRRSGPGVCVIAVLEPGDDAGAALPRKPPRG